MGNIGGGEIIVILLAALLILGPNKLPEAARQIGRAMGELRKVTSGFQREMQDALKDTDDAEARKKGEAVAASRPLATGTTSEPTPSAELTGSEPITMDDAAAQIPPAPAGDDISPAPGSDR